MGIIAAIGVLLIGWALIGGISALDRWWRTRRARRPHACERTVLSVCLQPDGTMSILCACKTCGLPALATVGRSRSDRQTLEAMWLASEDRR